MSKSITTLQPFRTVRVHFADGNHLDTSIRGTEAEIRDYYVGQFFNFGDTEEHPKDRMVEAVSVTFLDRAMPAEIRWVPASDIQPALPTITAPDTSKDEQQPIRFLTCCCCGGSAIGRQWWNRDTGYGLCVNCIPLCSRGETPEDFTRLYGVRGVHFDVHPIHHVIDDPRDRPLIATCGVNLCTADYPVGSTLAACSPSAVTCPACRNALMIAAIHAGKSDSQILGMFH